MLINEENLVHDNEKKKRKKKKKTKSSVAGRGTPSRAQEWDSCLTLGNELSMETHVLTKQKTLLKSVPEWRVVG